MFRNSFERWSHGIILDIDKTQDGTILEYLDNLELPNSKEENPAKCGTWCENSNSE